MNSASIYFWGWFVALIVGLTKMMIGLSIQSSIKSRNLKKIGLFYCPWSGHFIYNQSGVWDWILCVTYVSILAPMFSWISAISGIWGIIAAWANRVEPPDQVKIIRFKIASMDLTEDQLIELQHELNETLKTNLPVQTTQGPRGRGDPSLVPERGEAIDKSASTQSLLESIACHKWRLPQNEEYQFCVDFLKMTFCVCRDELESGLYSEYILSRRGDDWFIALYEQCARSNGPSGDLVYKVRNSQVDESVITKEQCLFDDLAYHLESLNKEINGRLVSDATTRNMLTLKYNHFIAEREQLLRKSS